MQLRSRGGSSLWDWNRFIPAITAWAQPQTVRCERSGTTVTANRAIDNYVYERVRNFLRRRHKVQSRSGTQFSSTQVFGKLGATVAKANLIAADGGFGPMTR